MVASKFLKYAFVDDIEYYSLQDLDNIDVHTENLGVVGRHSLYAVAAAINVGLTLKMSKDSIVKGVKSIQPLPGRMQKLSGIKGSVLIDDTYNSSPEAVKAALDYIYSLSDSVQRIVLLGNMNELGDLSRQAHLDIGSYCDPSKLNLVITLGEDANKYTAVAARAHGCKVLEAKNPYQAAEIIKKHLQDAAVVLIKGSQNGVFAEETTKLLLADSADVSKLVRQSVAWKIKKQVSFGEK